ncbi:hypothetical protein LWP59_09405 [Amycolatopsis acidiphila]|uniref:Uncharacterized protein n=1 Tax=Amycolatopsis acidiphila TaxID=715473 RepID=A0A558A5X6_9PSEU|nr:hypothetical protein [Amycolatopsis acidiphila]TVT19671.1 hypothetical protein FNH06_23455 [Amycolatopsis acidiphila]UIJ61811.1 hypothetical protein LWP59_09405 [Amycolatopsis acidiphila]GHG57818.1 hypothetical protein GCM10017788_09690 [Amycolatopsis acidiphila]
MQGAIRSLRAPQELTLNSWTRTSDDESVVLCRDGRGVDGQCVTATLLPAGSPQRVDSATSRPTAAGPPDTPAVARRIDDRFQVVVEAQSADENVLEAIAASAVVN